MTEDLTPRLLALVRLVEREAAALTEALPDALSRQWEASTRPRPAEDTPQRSAGGAPRDPVADTVADPYRLEVRATALRAEKVLRDTAVALRGSRIALQLAVAEFDGDRTAAE